MTWSVVLSGSARRDLKRLNPNVAERVLEALARLAETGHGDLKYLRGSDDAWRLRVGDWRVKLVFDHAGRTITVLWVRPRGRVYRD